MELIKASSLNVVVYSLIIIIFDYKQINARHLIWLLILLMSILFIGEKSNHFSNHPHFWMDKNEQQAIVNQKKITQQQYR